MRSIAFTTVPPIEELRSDVEYFRIAEYAGSEAMAIKVCPNGLPGLVFQHSYGRTAIKCIVTDSGRIVHMPTLFLHGQITELAVMNFINGPFVSVQAVLKPHALKTLFGLEASMMTNANRWYADFAAEALNAALVNTKDGQECAALLSGFLLEKLGQALPRDLLIEESLHFIQRNIRLVTVKDLLEHLHISERPFQKRFMQTVGVTPQFYIRVRRFNEAIRLMDTGEYDRLSDVAHALHFHDQSHFIRDMKQFSGVTPKSVSQKVNQFHHDEIGASYLA
ncbi:helix-turn-helix domain-containing protein [Paenibacillus allorhizosphaerae]|nr:helix-turn-helix transcriptional regulator [Paenibacillus allorhizosphaerae]